MIAVASTPMVTEWRRLRSAVYPDHVGKVVPYDRADRKTKVNLCLPRIRPIGSRRPPEVFVMEPTDAWHLHHPALTWRVHTPRFGRVLGQR
jgi:hypothetical protein